MTRRWLVVLLGAILVACGKYGPPQRVRHDPAPAVQALETAPAEAPAAEPDDDEEKP